MARRSTREGRREKKLEIEQLRYCYNCDRIKVSQQLSRSP
jgi:hypothetical protein